MSSVCISNCVNDARDPRVPVRATYVNLYKWPESDAEFVRSVSSRGCKPSATTGAAVRFGHPRVVDSISCRQMYLRSYKFSREEDHDDQKKKKNAQKCFGCRVNLNPKLADDDHDRDDHAEKEKKKKKKSSNRGRDNNISNKNNKKKKRCLFLGKVKEISYAALFGIFRRCLSCAATVDVVDQHD